MSTGPVESRDAEAVLITGAASGIGLACAAQAAARGARVGLIDRDGAAAERALDTLAGDGHLVLEADVADADAVRRAVQKFDSSVGPLTGVVAAAGIVSRSALSDISPEEFYRVLMINVGGVQNVFSASIPSLIRSGTGASMVALASVAAYTGGGLMGSGAYAASKGAVIGLVRGYARELAPHRVRANAVAPGATETPMTAVLDEEDRARLIGMSLIGRLADADEIAAAVDFLISSRSGAITGQTMHVNGGVYFG